MAAAPILIAFDVECTGGDFAKNAMVEIGAVAYRYERERERDRSEPKRPRADLAPPLSTFESIMRVPEERGWDGRCVREFWDNPDRPEHLQLAAKKKSIEETKMTPEEAMTDFAEWIDSVVALYADGDPKRVRFVSDNAAYDAAWIGLYLCAYAGRPPLTEFFGKFQAVIDTSSFHQGISLVDHVREREIKEAKGWYSEDRECRAFLGVPDDEKPNAQHDHRAVHDAAEIVQQHLIILKHMNRLDRPRVVGIVQKCGEVRGAGAVGNSLVL